MKNNFLKQIVLLIFLGSILIGIVTAGVYVVMEGPSILVSLFSSTKEDVTISKNETSVDKLSNALSNISAPKDSRVRKDNTDYIKINVFELYELCDTNEKAVKGKSYVMRGIVHKPTHLTDKGQFGLMRIVMWCCAADSTAYGFRVPYTQLDSIKDGTWIKIYGRPIKKTSLDEDVTTDKTFATYDDIQKEWIFDVDHVETTHEPKDPFITYWSRKEPFKY